MLRELARTDSHRFRVLVPDSDETKALRALSRAREDLVQTRVALCNQLAAELEPFWPGAIEIFDAIDSPIGLAFLERHPSPSTPVGWARSAWRRSSLAIATVGESSPPSCSPSSELRPRAAPASWRPRRAERSYSRW